MFAKNVTCLSTTNLSQNEKCRAYTRISIYDKEVMKALMDIYSENFVNIFPSIKKKETRKAHTYSHTLI